MPNSKVIQSARDDAVLAIILVNWNGWRDTIECLESIFKNAGNDFQVIVCDNASSDESCDKITQWASGQLVCEPASTNMAQYSSPQITKPIKLKYIDENGNTSGDTGANLILIQTGSNLGFAGGNNVGLQYAQEHSECEYFWLLNNDTVIEENAIKSLIAHMQASPNVGMCGTRIQFYCQPDVIQALGGATYNPWTGTSQCIANYEASQTQISDHEIVSKCDFIVGASMCLTREFLEKVGFMEEKYFLYYEEIDWARRAKGKFEMGYASGVTVYHKEGGAIGSSSVKGSRSALSEYYLMRSKLLFTRSHYPTKLPSVYLYGIGQVFIRLLRGKKNLAKAITLAMIGKNLP